MKKKEEHSQWKLVPCCTFVALIKEEETDAAEDEEGCGSDLHARHSFPCSAMNLNRVRSIHHQARASIFRGA